jgi:hypothetical protein
MAFRFNRRIPMKKRFALYLAVVGLAAMVSLPNFFTGSAQGGGNPQVATISEAMLIPTSGVDVPWVTVLKNHIKTGSKKDLLIGASLQTGLHIDTTAGETSTAQADAFIGVRIKVDNVSAHPAFVVYEARVQKLEANFSDLNGTINEDTGFLEITDPEVLRLLLRYLGAHHFNFVVANLSAGDHTVEVQMVDTSVGACWQNRRLSASGASRSGGARHQLPGRD